jgi:hypothetical protein
MEEFVELSCQVTAVAQALICTVFATPLVKNGQAAAYATNLTSKKGQHLGRDRSACAAAAVAV